MEYKIVVGDIKKCVYAGCMGNFFGAKHDTIYKKNAILIELAPSNYVEIENLFISKKRMKHLKHKILTPYAHQAGDLFVDETSLVDIRDLAELKNKQNQKTK